MVKSVENGTTLPPFLVKCYEMVNDESTDELISWTESNDSFVIWDESKFASELLPKYFKHSNFSSFVRQLNIYGFRKIDTDQWQFANEAFIKGQKHLLKNITRRKQPQSPVQKNPPQQKDVNAPQESEEDRRVALWKEVENLKTDKNALTQQLKKLRQHQQLSQNKLLLVRDQLQGMEKNQQQMLSFIVMAMQSPEFMVQFFQPKENNSYNKLSEVTDDCGPSDDKMIVPYQPLIDDHSVPPEASNAEDFMELDFSSDEMRDFFKDIDFSMDGSDGKVGPSESDEGQLVIPDIPENEFLLEELLSSNPSTEIERLGEFDDDDGEDVTTEFGGEIDVSDKVEVITKKMGSLASEMR